MIDSPIPLPPPELVQQWQSSLDCPDNSCAQAKYIAARAARWGADQELEACCDFLELEQRTDYAALLRAARRPKPPSLKEQSIALIDRIQGNKEMWDIRDLDVIRRALEQLDD